MSHPETRKKHILLVEDEDVVRKLLHKFLKNSGYEVHEAPDSDTATQIWTKQKNEIDLLLTDIVLEGAGSGKDFAKQLRLENPGLKVIFTSGLSRDSIGEVDPRETSFVQKPYSPDTLLSAVRSALGEI